jgi:hypothetical protein
MSSAPKKQTYIIILSYIILIRFLLIIDIPQTPSLHPKIWDHVRNLHYRSDIAKPILWRPGTHTHTPDTCSSRLVKNHHQCWAMKLSQLFTIFHLYIRVWLLYGLNVHIIGQNPKTVVFCTKHGQELGWELLSVYDLGNATYWKLTIKSI